MEHVTLTQEILKWFAGLCLIMMVAFIAYGGVKGLYMERFNGRKRKISY